jgi:acetolactate synthase-1/2/3 large subunit
MGQTAAGLMAQALQAASVEVVFTLPGSHIRRFLDEVRAAGIRVVPARHETSAVMMAAGYALSTGRVGVAAVTGGPGVTCAMGGIGEAHASGIPVVVLAGRTALRLQDRGAVQDLDQETMVRPVSKWRARCLDPARAAFYLSEAVYHARSGRPGVAYLEVPEDVLAEPGQGVDPRLGRPGSPRPVPSAEDLDRVEETLLSADRPVILCGSGAFFSGAGPAVASFSTKTGIPVITTSAARGIVSDAHPNCLGSLVHAGSVLLSADVVLLLGSAFNANLVYGSEPLFSASSRVVQIDLDPAALGGQRRPYLGLLGDVSATVEALDRRWEPAEDRWEGWRRDARGAVRASRALWVKETQREVSGIHPGRVALKVADLAKRVGAPLVIDGGDTVVWGLAFAEAFEPGRHLVLGSAMGTLGVGVPYAVAAALAHDSPVVLLTGDGAFGMTGFELDTAARQGLGVLTVVIDNGGWGGPGPGFEYWRLGQAVSGWGTRVERPDQLDDALEEGWRRSGDGTPAVVDVVCPAGVHSQFMIGVEALGLM